MKHIVSLFVSIICCSVFSVRSLRAEALDQSVLVLRSSCERLMDDPGDKDAIKTLFAYARNTNGVDRLRSRCMAGVALSALFTGNTNLYIRARNSHARNYPEDMHLLRINLKNCLISCKECKGKGYITKKCPVCQGKGIAVCPVCKGKGVRMKKLTLKGSKSVGKFPCGVCNETGKVACKRCGGSGEIKVKCKACKGKPFTFKISSQVHEDFGLIVRGIVKWVNNEEVFHKKYQVVKQLDDIGKRIAEYRKLIRTYSYRDEVVELENLLAADVKMLKEQNRIAREKESIAKQEVRSLLKLKDSETPFVAAAAIREYLVLHPDCKSKVELQTLVVQLEAKDKKKRRQRYMIYVLCGTFIFLFGLSCIHITHYKYDIFSIRSKLPGEKE